MSRVDDLRQLCTIETDECILWPYATVIGYGRLRHNDVSVGAHCLVAEWTHGPRPARYEAAHACGNRACVNPRHIRWATWEANSLDKWEHGRQPTRLSATQVDGIRRNPAGLTVMELASQYGVTVGNVRHIQAGRTWRHLLAAPAA